MLTTFAAPPWLKALYRERKNGRRSSGDPQVQPTSDANQSRRNQKDAMRIRDLRFGTVNAWPPCWRARPGIPSPLGEGGTLGGVRVASLTPPSLPRP